MSTKGSGKKEVEKEEDEILKKKNYVKLKQIGSGSFGQVYKALNRKTGQIVAIKIIDLNVTEDDIDDIENEINVLRKCSSPHIVSIYGSFSVKDELWIVMEYVSVGSIADLIEPKKSIEEKHCRVLLKQILLGLEYLHSCDLIHRDLKAANILVNEHCAIKIADFGVCGEISNAVAALHSFVGTPYWMAPEIIKQEQGYGKASDIWSLGILGIEMSTGLPPLYGKDPRYVLFEIPKRKPPKLEGSFSKNFKDFISKCLQMDPSKRATAKELLQHEFIKNGSKKTSLLPLVTRYQEYKKLQERNNELDDDEDDDDYDEDDENTHNKKQKVFFDFKTGGYVALNSDQVKGKIGTLREMKKKKQWDFGKIGEFEDSDDSSSSSNVDDDSDDSSIVSEDFRRTSESDDDTGNESDSSAPDLDSTVKKKRSAKKSEEPDIFAGDEEEDDEEEGEAGDVGTINKKKGSKMMEVDIFAEDEDDGYIGEDEEMESESENEKNIDEQSAEDFDQNLQTIFREKMIELGEPRIGVVLTEHSGGIKVELLVKGNEHLTEDLKTTNGKLENGGKESDKKNDETNQQNTEEIPQDELMKEIELEKPAVVLIPAEDDPKFEIFNKIIKPAITSVVDDQDLLLEFVKKERQTPDFSKQFLIKCFECLKLEKDIGNTLGITTTDWTENKEEIKKINTDYMESKLKSSLSYVFFERWKTKLKKMEL